MTFHVTRKFCLLILLIFLATTLRTNAQSGNTSPGIGDLPDFIPPTPEARAMFKAEFLKSSPYTGAATFTIPVHTVNSNGFKLPISLSYNTTGVKVNDIASMVGLGWNLDFGGVISRTVLMRPDEFRSPDKHNLLSYDYSMDIPPWLTTIFRTKLTTNSYCHFSV